MSYYVTHENSVLNINNAHLKVSGNVQTDVLKLGAMEFAPPASDVPGTVNFTNVTTGVTTTSNLNVGGTLMLGSVELVTSTSALEQTVNLGNTTSNTVQFTNATTGIVATGNVETQGKFIGDGSLLTGITTIESNVDLIRNTDNTAFINLNSNVVTEFPRSKKLIKYPRVALTSAAGESSGYQGYKVTSSFSHSGYNDWEAFDNGGDTVGWHTANGTSREYNNGGEGTYSGTLQTRLASNTELGEWLQIELPHAIRLERYVIIPQGTLGGNAGNSPGSAVVYGSNDGTTWKEVHRYTDHIQDSGGCKRYTFQTSTIEMYNRFAIVVTKRGTSGGPGNGVSIQEWELYGIPEYDPEAHGTDVVVKSDANVPNTDWLEVYYDAKDLTGVPSSVLDLSGNSRNGVLDGVTFDSASKSFVFDGVNDKIDSGPMTFTPALSYSVSTWVKVPEVTSSQDLLFQFGHGTSGEAFGMNYGRDGQISTYIFSGQTRFTPNNLYFANEWVHVTGIWYNSGIMEIYVNGTRVDNSTSGNLVALSIPSNPYLTIGIHFGGEQASYYTGVFFKGSIANFRLFNRALSQDEIYQLYAYQKEYFGHGDLSMTLKAGRLGIGTSEPRAALDVRGDVAGRFTRFLTYDHVVHSSTTFNSSPSWPIGQSLSLVSHTWDIPTEYAALGRGTLNGYAYVSWSGSCPNPWQAVFWIDIYYNGVYMGRGSTNSDVGNTSANHGNTTVALTHHDEDNNSTLDSANVTTGFRLPNCNLSRGSTIKIDLVCQRGDYQSGENVVWTNRNHTAPSSNARDYEQGTTNFFVLLNVE